MIGRCSPRISHFPIGGFGVSHSDVTLWETQIPDSLLHGVRSAPTPDQPEARGG